MGGSGNGTCATLEAPFMKAAEVRIGGTLREPNAFGFRDWGDESDVSLST